MKKKFSFRLLKLLIINIIIFICLLLATLFFQFLFFGWGASTNSPKFNFDYSIISQLIILFLLSFKKYNKRINYEMILVFGFILLLFLMLKYIFHIL